MEKWRPTSRCLKYHLALLGVAWYKGRTGEIPALRRFRPPLRVTRDRPPNLIRYNKGSMRGGGWVRDVGRVLGPFRFVFDRVDERRATFAAMKLRYGTYLRSVVSLTNMNARRFNGVNSIYADILSSHVINKMRLCTIHVAKLSYTTLYTTLVCIHI